MGDRVSYINVNDLTAIAVRYNFLGVRYSRSRSDRMRHAYKARMDEIYNLLCLLGILHHFNVYNSNPPYMSVKKGVGDAG